MSSNKFSEVVLRWYKKFNEMKIGDRFEISICAPKNPDLFIDMIKCYMDFEQGYKTHEFSNDFKYFKRIL